jgi:hypothetical protein
LNFQFPSPLNRHFSSGKSQRAKFEFFKIRVQKERKNSRDKTVWGFQRIGETLLLHIRYRVGFINPSA